MISPLLIFAYKRPEKIGHLLESLRFLNQTRDVHIFIDGPKAESDLRKVSEVVSSAKLFKAAYGGQSYIYANLENVGLAGSIINGIDRIFASFENYDSVIILEDDLIPRPGFFEFMDSTLRHQYNNMKVWSVSAWRPTGCGELQTSSLSAIKRPTSWGWGTWRNRWEGTTWHLNPRVITNVHKSKWDICGNDLSSMFYLYTKGAINSWAVRWAAFHLIYDKYSVYPPFSLIINDGFDGSGEHCGIRQGIMNETVGDVAHVLIKAEDLERKGIHLDDPKLMQEFKSFFNIGPMRSLLRIVKWRWVRPAYRILGL